MPGGGVVPAIIILLLSLPSPAAAQQAALTLAPDTTRTEVGDLIAQADGAQRNFNNRKALALYSEALAIESRNPDILWRVSRSYLEVGEHLPSATDQDRQKQLEMYEEALAAAARSIAADDDNSMAYTYHAIALSRVGLFKGFWEYVGILKDTRKDLKKAIAIDSTNHLAYYALGMACLRGSERPWIFRWPLGIAWANTEQALRYFEKASMLRGDLIKYQLACARVLVTDGEYDRARVYLRRISELQTMEEDDEQYRREATELFDRIKDED